MIYQKKDSFFRFTLNTAHQKSKLQDLLFSIQVDEGGLVWNHALACMELDKVRMASVVRLYLR